MPTKENSTYSNNKLIQARALTQLNKLNKIIPTRTLGQLNSLALAISQQSPRPRPEWIDYQAVKNAILTNQPINKQLRKIAYKNPQLFRLYLDVVSSYALKQTQGYRRFTNSDPSIVTNINHPLNPNNPNNLMLNPTNLINTIFIDTQAAILASINEEDIENIEQLILTNEIEETEENEEQFNLLTDEKTLEAAANYLENETMSLAEAEKLLNINQGDDIKTIQQQIETPLLLNAPEETQTPSHAFSLHAAAAFIITANHHTLENTLKKLDETHPTLIHELEMKLAENKEDRVAKSAGMVPTPR